MTLCTLSPLGPDGSVLSFQLLDAPRKVEPNGACGGEVTVELTGRLFERPGEAMGPSGARSILDTLVLNATPVLLSTPAFTASYCLLGYSMGGNVSPRSNAAFSLRLTEVELD